MSSYVFKKPSNQSAIQDLFSHLVPKFTSVHTHIGIHEVVDPRPRRVFISHRLTRLVTLLQALRGKLVERFGLLYRSPFWQRLAGCEHEICELLDYMKSSPELDVSEHAMPVSLLRMLWTLNSSLRNYYNFLEARDLRGGLPTSEEAEAFGRAQVARLLASEARQDNQTLATRNKPQPLAMSILPITPDMQPEAEALTSKDIQDLMNQIKSLRIEVTELKARQTRTSTALLPPALDPILEDFLAAQQRAQVKPTPSMMTDTASIVPPPYALSDVGAKDCIGERYAEAPIESRAKASEIDGRNITLRRLVEEASLVAFYALSDVDAQEYVRGSSEEEPTSSEVKMVEKGSATTLIRAMEEGEAAKRRTERRKGWDAFAYG